MDDGNRLHKAVETGDLAGLDGDELEAVQKAQAYRDNIIAAHALPVYIFSELRLPGSKVLDRGILDCVIVSSDRCDVIDYKFGQRPVAPAADNWQGKYYAAKLFEQFLSKVPSTRCKRLKAAPKTVTVHFTSPNIDHTTWHEFTPEVVDEVIRKRFEVIDQRLDPFKLPDPASQELCSRCAHAFRCPAIRGTVDEALVRLATNRLPVLPANIDISAITDSGTRAELQRAAGILKPFIEAVESDNLRFAKAGNDLPGYTLVNRAGGQKLLDPVEALRRLIKDKGLNPIEALEACSTTAKKLYVMWAEMNHMTAAEAEQEISALFADLIIERPNIQYLTPSHRKKTVDKPKEIA